jgi:hypothetical protein
MQDITVLIRARGAELGWLDITQNPFRDEIDGAREGMIILNGNDNRQNLRTIEQGTHKRDTQVILNDTTHTVRDCNNTRLRGASP